MILVIIALIFVALLALVAVDFSRFKKARRSEKSTAAACHSGGILSIESNATYYTMPNGVKRKLADYPMDLDPKSKDMQLFSRLMDQANRERESEKVTQMQKVAREVTA